MRTTIRTAALAVLVGLAGAACTTTRAAVPLDRPGLEVPPPPPRIVVPLPAPQPDQLEPVQALGPGSIESARPRVQREKEAPKVEPKPEDPKPVEPPPAAPPVQQPPPQLRLPESSGSPQVGQIVEAIARYKRIIERVDADKLSETGKKALKEASIFASQAEQEMQRNNLPLAKEFADKAERLAKELQR